MRPTHESARNAPPNDFRPLAACRNLVKSMRASFRPLLPIALLLAGAAAHGQVYTCVGEDGTRIYSSSRCGPDAKIVPGVGSYKKKPAAKSNPAPIIKGAPAVK